MRVLIACEFSGVVRRAFSVLENVFVFSCDILPCDDGSKNHYKGDVKEILYDGWDLMIAHPPCTYLANSGVRWLHSDSERWNDLDKAALFFKLLMNAPIEHIAIENPVMHKYGVARVGRKQDQTIQPWQFGHGESKRTCLWLKNLPLLKPTDIVKGREQRSWKLPPSRDRWKLRSITYYGIAQAMANQWGYHLSL